MNIFSSNSVLGRALNLIADIVIVHFMWVIFSIPIFTIGASTTGLYYSLMKRQRRDEGYVYSNFIKGFKDSFKQSTIVWLILLAAGAIIVTDIRIGMYAIGTIGNIMIFTSSILLIPYILICTYIFPVIAKFENSIIQNLKNSILLAIAHFGYTLLILVFLILFVFGSLFSPAFLGIALISGAGLYGFLTANIYIMVFRKHLPDELEEDAKATGMDKFY